MKARPLPFSAPMVRALLDGRKTQTRRVVKPQHEHDDSRPFSDVHMLDGYAVFDSGEVKCPYGQPGDLLWVRERFSLYYLPGMTPAQRPDFLRGPVWYWADGNPADGDWERPRPSNHMPRWASCVTLEITDVRVERLQAMSEDDAVAEGLSALSKDDGRTTKYGITDRDALPGTDNQGWEWKDWKTDPRLAYRHLWNSINGPGSWDANPWVWALTFRVRHCNVDALLEQRGAA